MSRKLSDRSYRDYQGSVKYSLQSSSEKPGYINQSSFVKLDEVPSNSFGSAEPNAREFFSKQEENFQRFIYDIEDPSKEFETLEHLDKPTRLLFEIIKMQLMNLEHPLNIVMKRFAFYFVKHYAWQII